MYTRVRHQEIKIDGNLFLEAKRRDFNATQMVFLFHN